LSDGKFKAGTVVAIFMLTLIGFIYVVKYDKLETSLVKFFPLLLARTFNIKAYFVRTAGVTFPSFVCGYLETCSVLCI